MTAVLSVSAFIAHGTYDIEPLYIDKFWSGLSTNDWVRVDYEMLRWMGYECIRNRDCRSNYLEVLNRNFIEHKDFDIIDNNKKDNMRGRPREYKIIIVRTRQFKESLMLLQTERAKIIRRYFTTLEEIFIDYLKYTQAISNTNHELEKAKLIEENKKYKTSSVLMFDIDPTPIELTEYVYVLTSNRYYNKHMFKIGKSINPKNRLVSHNTTSATDDDAMFYTDIIPTFDCGGLEKLLHRMLSKYHTTKEWFHIPHAQLRVIIDLVSSQQLVLLSKINECISDSFDIVESMPINEFATFVMDEEVIQSEEPPSTKQPMKCDKCAKIYTSRLPYQKHIDKCDYVSSSDVSYTCEQCSTIFTTINRYTNHIDGGCPYHNKCNNCEHVFKSHTALLEHARICKPLLTSTTSSKASIIRNLLNFSCSKCSKTFKSRLNAQKHCKLC